MSWRMMRRGQCSFGGFDKFGVYPVHEAAKDVPKL